ASSALLGTLLISLIVGNALSALLDGTLMSFRKGHYILLRAAIVNIPRLVLPFFVVHAGLQGIVGTYVIMLALGAIYNIIVIVRLLRGAAFKPRLDELRGHTSFAASNYFGGMLGILPSTVLPILVLNNIGAAQAAYFYMPMQLAAFLGIICNATATALFSEASQQDNGKPTVHLAKAIRHMYQLLIPAAIGLALAGWGLLHLYGPAYVSNGYLPLLLLCAASLFIGINWIGDTWLNIQKRSFAYFAMNAVNAILVVGTAFITVRHGLLALAWGWLAAQAASAAIYLVLFARPQVRRFMTRS
ncbi:MAG TPA: hypothetical protein VD735_00330, partial [Candidatus Saccharimonadales bacterium]|nr:hypothetical protein [Candidatus Saccharimonadales bacterium]